MNAPSTSENRTQMESLENKKVYTMNVVFWMIKKLLKNEWLSAFYNDICTITR